MSGRQPVTFEYLEIPGAEDLSSLQGQQRDLVACLLQAVDGVVNVKLGGLRFTKSDAAFLVEVCNLNCVSLPNPRASPQGRSPRTPGRHRSRRRAPVA